MVFLESLLFSSKIYTIIDDDEYAALQDFLSQYPESGAIIRGSKGIRKARWSVEGKGKRSGARVIYYWHVSDHQILMIDVYRKSEKETLTPQEIQLFQELVHDFVRHE